MSWLRGTIGVATGVLVLSGSVAAHAQPLSPEEERRVTDYVVSEMDALGVPGAAVVIVRGDDVVFARGFGETGGDEPMSARTPFFVGSVTESLTALAVMQLVESGDLRLSDRLGELIPGQVPDGSEAGSVTVEHLLGHAGGWTLRDGLVNRVDPDVSPDAVELNAARIVATPLSNPVGEFEHSSANYDVLGHLIAEVSGERYEDYMSRHVFEPLQMTHSFASEADAVNGGVATGHYPFFGVVRPHPMVFVPGSVPSAYLAASAEDLGHFLIAHLNDGRFGDRSVLSPEGVATLQRPVLGDDPADGYAMGLRVYPFFGDGRPDGTESGESGDRVPVWLEAVGTSESYASAIQILPEVNLGVVVLLNMNDETVDSIYSQMHYGITGILLGGEPGPTVAFEGLVDRYAKVITLVVLGLLLLRVGASADRLRRYRRSPPSHTEGVVLRRIVLPLVVDLLLIGAIWWFLAARSGIPLTLVRRLVPDIFLAAVTASAVVAGWALVRTVLTLRMMARRLPPDSSFPLI